MQGLAHVVELGLGAAPQHGALQLLRLCLLLLPLDLLLQAPAVVVQLRQPLLQRCHLLLHELNHSHFSDTTYQFGLWKGSRKDKGSEFTSTSVFSWIRRSLRCSGPCAESLPSPPSCSELSVTTSHETLHKPHIEHLLITFP